MAIKFPGMKVFTGADAKSRVFLVFAAIAGISLVIFGIVHYFGGSGATGGGSKVATAPSGLQTVPGAQMSPEFYRAVVQANAQAAQQAQISGGSAVPTLINSAQQTSGFPGQNCTVLCPGDEGANVSDDINNLVKLGKLPQEDANHLLELAKNNVSVDEYAAALNDLVRQGKLTPEQARALLEKYKKQHGNALINESGQMMDGMIKSGQLSLDTANRLLALQKSGISPADYAAELNRLVKEGKISPEMAARLLAQYTQQQMREQAKQGAFGVRQMAKAGQITPDVANALVAMQNRNIPVDQYEAELNRLVAAGKMTPAAAAQLLAQYKQQRAGIGTAGTLSSLVGDEEANASNLLDDLVKSGKISQADADAIKAMERNAKSPEDCQNGLNQFVQAKKIPPDVAAKLLASCKKLAAVRAAAQRLAALQGNNASLNDYTEELKRAVASGAITPQMAATLLDQYRAAITPLAIPTGTAPGVEANIPGSEAFAQLQQRVATVPTGTPAVPETTQFQEAIPPPPQTAEAAADRLQRLQQLAGAMSGQAQTLINSWQPTVMVHREGSPADKSKAGEAAAGGAAGNGAPGKAGEKGEKGPKHVLIKAGTILFAILDTTVNSDYPDTPVLATIISGQFKGAKLLGKLALAQGQDRLSLNFNLMDMDSWPSTKSVSAFAIDPDTARTVMATSVDYHYLKRYGAMMGAAFVTGYSNAITQAGTSTTGIFGTSTTHPALNPTQKIAVGLGQVGTTMGAAIQSYINTPTTVVVNSGVGIGILFMSELAD